ncbi:MAG: class I SAM-dependent RNA methyltransferase [Candidatus Cloacimonetes bacterium]|nr:class I SAM-dependent RNA methyltransferase [Candidatus Cloacimonadota bacterium]
MEFEYQKYSQYFAQVAGKLEDYAAQELSGLGADSVTARYRGVSFCADKAALYRINYRARLITRVLAPLLTFNCHSTKYLYTQALKLDWQKLMSTNSTFAIFATVANSKIRHSHYAALVLKDAIADYFVNKCGERPSIDTMNPDTWLNLRIENNKAIISFDTSGGSLHRRGYRQKSVEAPMQETVAAAIISMSGWQGEMPLYDPFCGSGTLLSEAAMHYCRIPAGYFRERFGFFGLPDFDADAWEKVKAESVIRSLPRGLIAGSDISADAVSSARQNLTSFKQFGSIAIEQSDYRKLGKLENTIIVANPPYGLRLADSDLYDFGEFLKNSCLGSTAYVYFGKREKIGEIKLKPDWKRPLVNGALDGRLCKYRIY